MSNSFINEAKLSGTKAFKNTMHWGEEQMKKILLDVLICPSCLPEEISLKSTIREILGNDILEGSLNCPKCRRSYPVKQGVANLDPNGSEHGTSSENKYETAPVISSYLWSHYADILNDDNASDAYRRWADLIQPHDGLGIDAGAAVGRFTFEIGQKSDLAVGLDNSHLFIETARALMIHRKISVALKQEGHITTDVTVSLPPEWNTEKVEFIIADALALPFRRNTATSLASLNLVDKVPAPIQHLREVNRVTRDEGAQFLISDPFSWSEDVAPEQNWLGGQRQGPYTSRGQEHIMELLTGKNRLSDPPWVIETQGCLWWKIRTHANHYEHIRSCYIKAKR